MTRNHRSSKSSPSKVRTQTTQESIPTSATAGAADTDDKFRSFIENLPVLFYAVKPEPPYSPIYVSPAFQIFGYPLDQWLNDPDIWVKVIHEDDRQRVFAETVDSTNTGRNVQYEYRVICSDGTVMWVRDRGCLIRDQEGKLIHRQGVIADITLSKLAEQEVEKREKLYRTLAKSIPATAVLLFDSDLRYTLADGEQLRLHEYSTAMFENRTIWEVFPEDIANEWAVHYRRALNGEHLNFELQFQDRWLHINLLPVRDEKNEIFQGMVM